MTVVTLSLTSAAESPAPFDAKPWLEDLEQARTAVATRYANLEWVVLEREVDLSALFAATRAQLLAASSDAEARATFDIRSNHSKIAAECSIDSSVCRCA
jgi:hypothetical protein